MSSGRGRSRDGMCRMGQVDRMIINLPRWIGQQAGAGLALWYCTPLPACGGRQCRGVLLFHPQQIACLGCAEASPGKLAKPKY